MVITSEQESQSEQLVALVDPNELNEDSGFEVLNRSIAVITHSTDLHNLMNLMTSKQQ